GKPLVRRWVRRLPTHVVAISRAVAENVLGTSTLPNLTILPNAVGEEFFHCSLTRPQARQCFGLPQDVPIVGVPGTLRPVKGHPFFLEAFATVVRRMPQCLAAITGHGEPRYRGQLERLADSLHLMGKVRFLGTVNDMPAFYRACDVICIPSRSESFGRTAVEAMAAGTPVVATAVGGLQETIQPGKTGWLVPFGDADHLGRTLLDVLDDRENASVVAEQGRTQAARVYGGIGYRMRLIDMLDLVPADAGRRSLMVSAPQ
ncbi:MAG: glycosyltransferase family 4 protein, partial [Thermogutta sp.]